jgi:hypothetical protein
MKHSNQIIKSILTALCIAALAACGSAPRSQSTVLDEKSSIQISGDNLVGMTLRLKNGFSHTFSKDDLIKDVARLISIERSEDEKYQTVHINVDSGEVQASLYRGTKMVNSKTFFVTKGVNYQWRVN